MLERLLSRARIAELLGLRDGESAKTGRLFAFIFLMTASLVLARSAQRGIFLAAYPRSAIPDAFLLSAAVLLSACRSAPQTTPDQPVTGPATASPDDRSIYVPGVWVYRDNRFLWRPGYWNPVQAGHVWVPPSYSWTPAGYAYCNGYWDYPLANRGLLFAPAYIPSSLLGPGFAWTPTYALPLDFLSSALFVRGGRGSYWFGDYFGPSYLRAGFTPWVDYRIGRSAFDPLFAHSRAVSPGGARDLTGLFAARAAGTSMGLGIATTRLFFKPNLLCNAPRMPAETVTVQ